VTAGDALNGAETVDRTARRSTLLAHAVRAGLIGYAVVHLLVAYGWFAWSAAGFALGGRSSSGGSPESTTAKVLALPHGPWLVAGAGAVTAGVGIGLGIFGWRAGFVDQLDESLYEVLGGALGTAAVLIVGAGIAAFGLFLLARARHLNRESLTS